MAWRVREGRLHRVHAGVYAVGHRRLAWRGHMVAAVLACGDGAVLSHRSAGIWWGLLSLDAAVRTDVSVPRGRRGAAGVRVHRPRSLDAQDTTDRDGIPITSVARTLLDLAATAQPGPPRSRDRPGRAASHLRPHSHRGDDRARERASRPREARAGNRERARPHPQRARTALPRARRTGGPATTPRQLLPRSPRPRTHRGRLPLADAPPHRGDRRRRDPRNEDGVPSRPPTRCRAGSKRPSCRALHLGRCDAGHTAGHTQAQEAARGVGSRAPP